MVNPHVQKIRAASLDLIAALCLILAPFLRSDDSIRVGGQILFALAGWLIVRRVVVAWRDPVANEPIGFTAVVPVSAWLGFNVAAPAAALEWYQERTLLDCLIAAAELRAVRHAAFA